MRAQLPAFLCLTLSLPAAAYDVRTDSEGDLVKWTQRVELVLDTHAAKLLKDDAAELAIRTAVETLDEATPGLEVSLKKGDARPMGYVVGRTDNQNSILALEDWPYSEDALAVTLVTLNARTNEVLDADVAFNVKSHRFRVLSDAGQGSANFDDVQNTVTHELGHVLGLMHNDVAQDLVMYPSAPPGELIKRTLKNDDRDGLLSLYGTAPSSEAAPQVGCSSTGFSSGWVIFAGLLLALLRPRKAALLVLAPALALAAEPMPTAVTRAEEVALVQVVSRHSMVHPRHPGLIISELAISQVECLKGTCGELTRVVVAGGRVGDLEQVAVHEPVPTEGQRILVTRTAGQARVLFVEPRAQAQLVLELRTLTGWKETQGAGVPRANASQTPAITR